MENSDIEQRILKAVPGAELEVVGKDCDFSVTIIANHFEQMSTVKRQQLVLNAFTDVLTDGRLHALTIKAYTLDEWNQKSSHLVQLSL